MRRPFLSSLELSSTQIVDRVVSVDGPKSMRGLPSMMIQGAIGFLVVSVAGFTPWAVWGRQLHARVGELGMYLACLLVFLVLSGPFLHRLIIGPGSLPRFYKLFSIAFTLYAAGWILGWMGLRGHPGSVVGLMLGTLAMSWVMVSAFNAKEVLVPVALILFALNAFGYFAGGWMEVWIATAKPFSQGALGWSKRSEMRAAMLSWGVFYGLGFGAALGWAFHLCQEKARAILSRGL